MKLVNRTLSTAAIAAALALAPVGMSAASAAYPQPTFSCTITITTTTVGQSITISCTGLPPGGSIIIIINSSNPAVADQAIDVAGSKSVQKTVAADGTASAVVDFDVPGEYTVAVTDLSGTTLSSQNVTVLPAAATGVAAARLGATGTDALPIALGAGALLAAGVGTVVLVRRKNTA